MAKRNNSINKREVNNSSKKKSSLLVKIGCATALFAGLLTDPIDVKGQNCKDNTKEQAEWIVDSDILNNVQQKTGIKIPKEYEEKVRDFINYCDIFKNKDVKKYTENFIVEEMKKDWGYEIDGEDKELFIRSGISIYIANEDFYDGEDGNKKRLEAFENTIEKIDDCGERFVDGLTKYMENISSEAKQQSAEAKQQSAEAKQQSAEAKQQSAEAKQQAIESLNKALYATIDFYDSYKASPDIARLESFKQNLKKTILSCKEYGIDYKDFFLKKLGTKETDKLLKLFEIE